MLSYNLPYKLAFHSINYPATFDMSVQKQTVLP
jgi:hypothetical protein